PLNFLSDAPDAVKRATAKLARVAALIGAKFAGNGVPNDAVPLAVVPQTTILPVRESISIPVASSSVRLNFTALNPWMLENGAKVVSRIPPVVARATPMRDDVIWSVARLALASD